MAYARASENVHRKASHIRVALERDVEFRITKPGFEKYSFAHEALPEIDRDRVDTSLTLFGRRLSMPLLISPVTGGTQEAAEFNRRFARAAQRFGIAMGVGSQRVALENPALEETFRVRDIAPDILLFANLGAVQLNNGLGVESCIRAVEMIQADALVLHLNPLQECVQVRGNTNFQGLSVRIREVCDALDVPVIVKEVGHGISARTAKLLLSAGVDGIDVAGAGGTSWAKVESYTTSDPRLACLGESLAEWGIPTVESVIAVRNVAPKLPLIASGGVRGGEDIAKCIALGADAAGMALPLLKLAAESYEALEAGLSRIREELVTVMFCTGSRTLADLRASGSLTRVG